MAGVAVPQRCQVGRHAGGGGADHLDLRRVQIYPTLVSSVPPVRAESRRRCTDKWKFAAPAGDGADAWAAGSLSGRGPGTVREAVAGLAAVLLATLLA
jgi:hypothetical protein